MKRTRAKKAIVIGFDGAMPGFVLRFLDELPNIRALMQQGVFSPAVPSWPTDTPTNWTTIATGALTGTHGISGFRIQKPNEPLSMSHNTFDWATDLCEAEYIWEALERRGMRSILVNYPTAFPVRTKESLVVGGSGVLEPAWVVANSAFYSSHGAYGTTVSPVHRVQSTSVKLTLEKAAGWKNMVSSTLPPLEAVIPMLTGLELSWTEKGGITGGQQDNHWQSFYRLLVFAETDGRYDTVLVAKEKDAGTAVTVLKNGQWSDWIYDQFTVGKKTRQGVFKFKLVTVSQDGERVQLFRSDIGDTERWSYPAGLSRELIENVGPYIEGYECSAGLLAGWFAPEIAFEQARQHANYLADTCRYLATKNEWNLLMVQLHLQDVFNHIYLGYLYPDMPYYSAEDVGMYQDIFREVYKITDEMVGRIVNECVDEDTVVVVLSDHGAVPQKKCMSFTSELIKAGLVVYKKSDKDGICEIDWSKTKVFGKDYLWVNLKGRNPHGIVEPVKEYDKVRDKVTAVLFSIIDPETGRTPFEYIVKKEHAACLGLWGERIGDLVAVVSSEYVVNSHCPVRIEESQLKDLLEKGCFHPLPRICGPNLLVGGHNGGWPDVTVGDSSLCGMFIMAGPGVRENYIHEKLTISLADIAPTLCHLIGAPCPKDADGKILSIFLEED